MQKITIGTVLDTKHGRAKVTGMELVYKDANGIVPYDGIPMIEIWECDKDRTIFDLDNGHWAYGDEVTVVNND